MSVGRTRDVAITTPSNPIDFGGDVGDYIALMKPRVMSLVVFTALVGLWSRRVTCIR
jgi:heme O synthase-like polyprenyltransferase